MGYCIIGAGRSQSSGIFQHPNHASAMVVSASLAGIGGLALDRALTVEHGVASGIGLATGYRVSDFVAVGYRGE